MRHEKKTAPALLDGSSKGGVVRVTLCVSLLPDLLCGCQMILSKCSEGMTCGRTFTAAEVRAPH